MWMNLSLQDANSPTMEHMIFFHDHSMILMILIISSILYILYKMLLNSFSFSTSIKNEFMEFIWTIIPILILILIALPSMKLLYFFEEEISLPLLTIKILGNQWFWSYEYPEFLNVSFDSYPIMFSLLNNKFNLNFLDTDTHLILPFEANIRLLTLSKDVIHSWSIPNLGIKMDSIPGRINQMNLISNRPGIYFGNCMEICGENHSMMPISLEITSLKNFFSWCKSFN
uniref:Cytochrome c oxidase subunit 2 n=1 Tax=Tremex columba TaxID=222809 RepID=A0A3G5BC67_TRECO|nr:cytochrome c oxidase subunit II [Tremex columba]AYV97232.1 cytochrome c oxidase subunit 2 [Tremex columba]